MGWKAELWRRVANPIRSGSNPEAVLPAPPFKSNAKTGVRLPDGGNRGVICASVVNHSSNAAEKRIPRPRAGFAINSVRLAHSLRKKAMRATTPRAQKKSHNDAKFL
jgi:hypothetical protein